MCFLSAAEESSQQCNRKSAGSQTAKNYFWRWASVTLFFGFFGFAFFNVSPLCLLPFSLLSPSVGAAEVTWVTYSPGAEQGVTVVEPSSHCVHPWNFHSRTRAILSLSPLKITPTNEAGVWRGAEQMWKVVLRFPTRPHLTNVTHCTASPSDKCGLSAKVRGQRSGGVQRFRFLACFTH